MFARISADVIVNLDQIVYVVIDHSGKVTLSLSNDVDWEIFGPEDARRFLALLGVAEISNRGAA